MQIVHPASYWNGHAPENVFFVTDDHGNTLGTGFAVYQYLPDLYPDRPVNIYFAASGEAVGQYMLFGALVARARQLRDANPGEQARIYTCVDPEDKILLDFYRHSGMSCEEREIRVRLALPEGEVRVPMGCAIDQTPLYSPEAQMAFLDRLQQNNITHIDPTFLMELMRTEHFHAVGLFSGGQLAGEALVAGQGSRAELLAFYITRPFRRQGLGTALCRWTLWALTQEGVQVAGARFVTRSLPQKALARHLGASELETTAIFPQLFL